MTKWITGLDAFTGRLKTGCSEEGGHGFKMSSDKKETIKETSDNGVLVKNGSSGYGYKYSSLADLYRAGVKIPKMRIHPDERGDYVEYYDTETKTWEMGAKIIVPEARGMNAAQAYGAALTYARRYAVRMSQGVACDDDGEIENLNADGSKKTEEQNGQKKAPKVNFREVRERLTEIGTLEELNKYWSELGLTEKQAVVLKPDFTARKIKIGIGV